MKGTRTRLTAISFGLALAAAIFLLAWPVYSGFGENGPRHATLLEVNGSWAIVPVLFPVLITLMPLIVPRQVVRIIATIVLGGFVFIAGFTIGFFYLPADILMLLAACVEPSAKFHGVRP